MDTNTVGQLFEYRMVENLKFLLETWDVHPKTTEELFDFLDRNSQAFANVVLEDMVLWAGEDFWLDEITKTDR